MKLVCAQSNFAEWLASVSPPPLPIPKRERKGMEEDERTRREMTDRKIIDPLKINIFSDPAREPAKEVRK